jgi:hypothetical protein
MLAQVITLGALQAKQVDTGIAGMQSVIAQRTLGASYGRATDAASGVVIAIPAKVLLVAQANIFFGIGLVPAKTRRNVSNMPQILIRSP